MTAFFFVIFFSLSTLLGFACSLGINLGYNAHHHQAKSSSTKGHCPQHGNKQKQPVNSDDCCSNSITHFHLSAKSIVPAFVFSQPLCIIAEIFHIPGANTRYLNVVKDVRLYARNHHPPIADIRIAIQSFLI